MCRGCKVSSIGKGLLLYIWSIDGILHHWDMELQCLVTLVHHFTRNNFCARHLSNTNLCFSPLILWKFSIISFISRIVCLIKNFIYFHVNSKVHMSVKFAFSKEVFLSLLLWKGPNLYFFFFLKKGEGILKFDYFLLKEEIMNIYKSFALNFFFFWFFI